MSAIPYGEMQTIDITANNGGDKVTVAQIHYAFVIPCRDCKYLDYDRTNYFVHKCRHHDLSFDEPDGFCAWGERRDA